MDFEILTKITLDIIRYLYLYNRVIYKILI